MNPLLFFEILNFHDSSRINTGAQTAQAAGQVHCGILGFAYSQIPSQRPNPVFLKSHQTPSQQ